MTTKLACTLETLATDTVERLTCELRDTHDIVAAFVDKLYIELSTSSAGGSSDGGAVTSRGDAVVVEAATRRRTEEEDEEDGKEQSQKEQELRPTVL